MAKEKGRRDKHLGEKISDIAINLQWFSRSAKLLFDSATSDGALRNKKRVHNLKYLFFNFICILFSTAITKLEHKKLVKKIKP